MDRIILHSDLNSFYASVEIKLRPELRGKAVAVCGSVEERRGIVLAKSDKAKKAGIKTGMAVWQAKELCPELIVAPPRFGEYSKYSKMAREIYLRYTDRVEPFGMDECWLDLTGGEHIFGTGEKAADEIRQIMKNELGLTVSVGVSFNKVFAKLGSDIKKPDGTTVISKANFKQLVWPLPAEALLYVGPATMKTLNKHGIYTIGDIANAPEMLLRDWLGKHGEQLWRFANGLDDSRVIPIDQLPAPKSIGRGTTCPHDIMSPIDVRRVITELAQDVSHRLRENYAMAGGIQLSIRDSALSWRQFQHALSFPTQSWKKLAEAAFKLYALNYQENKPIRALTVTAISLMSKNEPRQIDIFTNADRLIKQERAEMAVEAIHARYGKKSIMLGYQLFDNRPRVEQVDIITLPRAVR